MKILVMGAGYVGMALLPHLHAHEIYLTTTSENKLTHLKTYSQHVLLLNSDKQGLKEMIEDCDAMVILIAPKNGMDYETTYLHTAKLVRSLLEKRKKPLYLLYTSSTSVYEAIEEEWATEDLVLKPQSSNAKILLEAEKEYLTHSTTCILRLSGIYGPQREIIERAKRLSGRAISGNQPTNHIHLEDIIAAIIFCLEKRLTGIYNLANKDHPSRQSLYTSLCNALHIPPPNWELDELGNKKSAYKVASHKIEAAGFSFSHPHLNLL
jgi:nucleoside-diphosphate-sugar epimerase